MIINNHNPTDLLMRNKKRSLFKRKHVHTASSVRPLSDKAHHYTSLCL